MTQISEKDALKAGYELNWYVIERILGQDGSGYTYLATDINLDQYVIIREFLPADLATRSDDMCVVARAAGDQVNYKLGLEKFLSDARILAKLGHTNITQIHSIFEANSTAYLILRYDQENPARPHASNNNDGHHLFTKMQLPALLIILILGTAVTAFVYENRQDETATADNHVARIEAVADEEITLISGPPLNLPEETDIAGDNGQGLKQLPADSLVPQNPVKLDEWRMEENNNMEKKLSESEASQMQYPGTPEKSDSQGLVDEKEKLESLKAEVNLLILKKQQQQMELESLSNKTKLAEKSIHKSTVTDKPSMKPVNPEALTPSSSSQENTVQLGIKAYAEDNFRSAIELLSPHADRGDSLAQYYVGLMYRNGQGILANNDLALEWILRAARQGQKEAQIELARLYSFGINGIKDMFLAYTWYLVAEKNGTYTFINERIEIENKLQREQLPQAFALASQLYTQQHDASVAEVKNFQIDKALSIQQVK